MQELTITRDEKQLIVTESMLNGSAIRTSCLDNSIFHDVSMKNVRIDDANLSDLEIKNAQLGGAYIHNIGPPPIGHPAYDPTRQQRPLRFEDCNLNGTTIKNCDLSGLTITDCNLKGMTINGIPVEELLKGH